MPVIAYRLQPWAFVDRLVFDLCPQGFEIVPMAGAAIAVAAARNFRVLRRRGITVRKTIDLLIATWCVENRRSLLHHDSDFHPMAQHLGLIEVAVSAGAQPVLTRGLPGLRHGLDWNLC